MKKLFLIPLLSILGFTAGAQDSTDCYLVADFTYTISGGDIFFTNTSTDEPIDAMYDWWIGGLSSTEENPVFPTDGFDDSEVVCFTVYDSLWECHDSLCMTIYFEEDTVIIDSTDCNLVADFTYTISDGNIFFTNTSTDEPADAMYDWWIGGLSSTEENPVFPTGGFGESEVVCFTVYDSLWECHDSLCTTIYFDMDSTDTGCDLVADFTYTYEDGNINLTNTSTGEFGWTTYYWMVDGLVSTEENPTFPTADFEESELICLTVTVEDSGIVCIDTVCYTFFFDDSTGVDSTASIAALEKLEVNIFPNPATDVLNVTVKNTNGTQQITIYNAIGKLVRTEQIGLSDTQIAINVADLPNGFYIINVIDSADSNRSLQQKFIKN